jgi:hypothetical protein
LSDIRPSRAEGEDALDLRLLVLRAEIEVEPILDDLAIRNLPEEDLRRDVDLAAPLGRLDDVLLVALEGDAPSQSLRPEACETLAVGAVDDNGLDPDVHEPTIRGTPLVSNGRVRGSPSTVTAQERAVEIGSASLTGVRGRVAKSVAKPIARRTGLTREQVEAIIGFLILAYGIYQVVRPLVRASRRTT